MDLPDTFLALRGLAGMTDIEDASLDVSALRFIFLNGLNVMLTREFSNKLYFDLWLSASHPVAPATILPHLTEIEAIEQITSMALAAEDKTAAGWAPR